jgi:hypothetical protein
MIDHFGIKKWREKTRFVPARARLRKTAFRTIYIYKRSFCQDRLGTNIGKALKNRCAVFRTGNVERGPAGVEDLVAVRRQLGRWVVCSNNAHGMHVADRSSHCSISSSNSSGDGGGSGKWVPEGLAGWLALTEAVERRDNHVSRDVHGRRRV